ncbi:hypothetical protein [Natranaeroarchaeum aerophilus]|uniref:Uncharacterized protein n=1 Tax=Natranaeroarchaeum aerophilus TaxID=2917711 RepID=A0AAE3FSL1_9EURY|nr:hypothetical protein [Natranaeroarchaeum aerophilus]MCL9814456.1 hypothetical protein [Natranaeroarchaeum aerophilus]
MPANTQTTRRAVRTTSETADRHATPATETPDSESAVPTEQTEASADAPAMFGSTEVVLPNLFDRNNELVTPDTE